MTQGKILWLEVYGNDVVIRRAKQKPKRKPAKREEIVTFSEAARKRLAFIASNSECEFLTMITLTYPREWTRDGRQVKRHLQAFIKRLKRKFEGFQFEYLWFLEFQKRGAPHIHFLVDIDSGKIQKDWMSLAWYEIVNSGSHDHYRAGTRVEALRKPGAWYAVKYARKATQKIVPKDYRNVGRFYGYSPGVKPVLYATVDGDVAKLAFNGVKNGESALINGYAVAFNTSGQVMENLVNDKQTEGI